MQQAVASNVSPWRIFGTRAVPNTVFAFPDQLTDMIDTTTEPVTDVSDTAGRYVIDCDGGGLCLARFWGSDTEDFQFNVRIYTWSKRVGYGYDDTPAWSPHFHGELTCTIGTKQVNGTGSIVTSDSGAVGGFETAQTYADDISIDINSGLGSGMRLIGRDNGAGDGTITADNDALILVVDRLNHQKIEFQFSTIDAANMRGECAFASLV